MYFQEFNFIFLLIIHPLRSTYIPKIKFCHLISVGSMQCFLLLYISVVSNSFPFCTEWKLIKKKSETIVSSLCLCLNTSSLKPNCLVVFVFCFNLIGLCTHMHLSLLQGQMESFIKYIHSPSAPSCSLLPSLVHWGQQ